VLNAIEIDTMLNFWRERDIPDTPSSVGYGQEPPKSRRSALGHEPTFGTQWIKLIHGLVQDHGPVSRTRRVNSA
jgi:hypothetical protein